MDVKEIIEEYLADNGYDGLFIPGECGCQLGQLFPCESERIQYCELGYKHRDPTGEFDFKIGRNKPK